MKTAAIIVENLTRLFGNKTAVNDLSIEVEDGEVFGFLGHNGAGKTTTVRMLNGVLEAHGGSMHVLGMDPLTEGPALRARTGVLTEAAALELRLTARDNLLIYADLFGVPRDKVTTRVDELINFFQLSDATNQRAETFSTGMRQRLALARTLLHDPEVIFLDEPTNGLDPVAAHQVNELIANLAEEKGRTVFLCTHNLVEAQKLCDRVAVMEHGRLVAIGTRRFSRESATRPQEMKSFHFSSGERTSPPPPSTDCTMLRSPVMENQITAPVAGSIKFFAGPCWFQS